MTPTRPLRASENRCVEGMLMRGSLLLILPAVLIAACRWEPSPTTTQPVVEQERIEVSEEYRQEIENWQKRRSDGLLAEGGWLSLVGLEWIEPGLNSVGSSPDAMVRMPASVPETLGSITLRGTQAEFTAAPDAGVTHNGQPVSTIVMQPDTTGEPTELAVGSVTFYMIERGGKHGIRIKDTEAEPRKNFHGLEYFPIDPKYRVTARLVPYDPPKEIPIATVLGTTEPMVAPGSLEFEIDGRKISLDPVLESPDADSYFIIFGDQTNGSETYGAGRYVYADIPAEGNEVIVDFNRAYNPPCVFTDYATCPLPPAQNKLPIPIPAGEKTYTK